MLTFQLGCDIRYYKSIKKTPHTAMRTIKNASAYRANSPFTNFAALAVLSVGLWAPGSARAANVLVNPGAETGNSAGWTLDAKASIASTNGYQWNGGVNYPPTASNILAHTGEYVFKSYQDAGLASTRIYQDFAVAPGSQWSAGCYAMSHEQDYIASANYAHLQVAFYDSTGTNVVAVYGSQVLDPGNPFPSLFTIAVPIAVDASGWVYLEITNTFSTDTFVEASWSGTFSGNITTPAGAAYLRYQLDFTDSSGGGGSIFWDDCVLDKVVASDPDIVTGPTALVVVVGQNATFTALASGNTTLTYQWKKGTTDASGARFGGVNSATLTITNCLPSDAGNYSVVVSDANGSIQSVPVTLTVLNPAAANNALGPNAGFENAPVWSPWNPFNGTGLPSTNSTYYQVTNLVNVYEGARCAQIYAGGTDNGFWTHVPCTPGSVWKAAAHAYITSTTDDLTANNTCRLQVWFQDAGNTHIGPTYESFKIFGLGYNETYPMLPRDTWVYLPVTNVVDATDTPTNSVETFVAPPGASVINYQVYYFHPAGNSGGSVFWDDMELYQVLPVTTTLSVSGNSLSLSFLTRGGLGYSVLYKTNLADASWNLLTNGIPGSGSTVTVSDQITETSRFYRVQTQ
jgi:Immunoglobulin domain